MIAESPDHEAEEPLTKEQAAAANSNPFLLLLLQPYQWIKMLSQQLNPTFILGVFLVYGLSQGFSGAYFRVVADYYWKDVQRVQPSVVQLYIGFYYIPWIMKPLWGLLTDVFPVVGYRRRPYFIAAGVIGGVSASVLAFTGALPAAAAVVCLVGVAAGMAIADVVIDACIAKNSIEASALASDLQSLCGFCSSVGALIGYSTSGLFVRQLGAQLALGLLAIPPASMIFLGFVISEVKTTRSNVSHQNKVVGKVRDAIDDMLKTVKCPRVWKPTSYMYLSLALSISTHEGQFYWYTDPKAGPAFSQEFVGLVYAIGALASIVGVLIYHKLLKDFPFRNILFFAQLLYGISGMLDVVFVLRWNLELGLPDYFFVVTEECVSRIVTRIRWMPMIILSTKLCPPGIEGTFFALLMCIDSLGFLSSKWAGGLVLKLLNVSRTNFQSLWLAILIRNILRLATLALIFLVPKTDPSDALVSKENMAEEALQLVPIKQEVEV
ncbi:hypothetical protein Dimus_010937 [Dionaea muscipula]